MRNLKGFPQHGRDFFRARRDEVMLGDRQRDARDVDLLKCIGAQHFRGDLAGNGDHRNGIEHGRRQTGHKIGRSWPAGRDADAHAP